MYIFTKIHVPRMGLGTTYTILACSVCTVHAQCLYMYMYIPEIKRVDWREPSHPTVSGTVAVEVLPQPCVTVSTIS